MGLEGQDAPLPEAGAALLLPERPERVDDRDVDAVVVARGLDRGLRHVGHLLVAAGGEQRPAEQVVGPLAVGLAGDRLADALDRVGEVAVDVADPGLGDLHVRQLGLEGDRLLGRGLGPLRPGRVALEVRVVLRAEDGVGGVGEGEQRVLRHRVLEHLQGELEVLAGQAPRVALAAQVQVVGLEVLGGPGRELLLLLRREGDAQGLGDLARDLVLHLEDVRHLAVVALGPEREVGLRVHELGVDAQARAGAAQAAPEDEGRVELAAHLLGRHRLVPVGQDRGAREDLEGLDLQQLGDDVLGDPVAEVLVLLHPGEVLEVEDGDRLLRGLRGRAGPRVVELRRAPAARVGVALQPQELGLEVVRGLVAEVAVLLERPRQDPAELGRQGRLGLAQRKRARG